MSELKQRFHTMQEALQKKKINGALFFNHYNVFNPNFVYLTNYNETGFYIYSNKIEPSIFRFKTDEPKPKFRTQHIEKFGDLPQLSGRIGIDERHIPTNLYKRIKKITRARFVDISDIMENIRAIKNSNEIKQIKQNCKIVEKIYRKIPLNEKQTELELKSRIDMLMAMQACLPSFPTIVASDTSIANVHHTPSTKKISKPLLIDFGIKYKDYCTDCTRMFNSKYAKLLENVIEKIEPMLKPGTKCSDLDKTARKHFGSLSKKFITSLGHGIGIAVHELPNINKLSKDILKENMVITIEPGIYVPSGARIENMYLICKDGAEKLTDF